MPNTAIFLLLMGPLLHCDGRYWAQPDALQIRARA
jgi:hypothetical protein